MISAYVYALYKDKNRQTPFEFMANISVAVIPAGTIVPEGAVIPKGAIIPDGTVLPTGSVIPPGTVIPEGTVFMGNMYNPKVDQFDQESVKIPRGAVIPQGTVIPASAIIPLNTYLPEGKKTVVPVGAVIPKGSVIPSGTVVPNGSIVPLGTVIPLNATSAIQIPLGTVYPAGVSLPSGTVIPKVFTAPADITTADQLRTEYLKAYPNATDLVIGQTGTVNIPKDKKVCLPADLVLPSNIAGMNILDGTLIPKANSINVPSGTFINGVDAVEPLDWNASFMAKCARALRPMTKMDWLIFVLDVIVLYYAISIALCASSNSSTVAMHMILALLFAPFYVLYHVVFGTDAYQRYKLSNAYSFSPESLESESPDCTDGTCSLPKRKKKYLASRKKM